MKRLIAIDGPAGAGKSTVARLLAEKLGYLYIDTGAMYRAVTYGLLLQGADVDDPEVLNRALAGLRFELIAEKGQAGIRVDGQPVDRQIRSRAVEEQVSLVARQPAVRAYLREKQRKLALSQPSVTEGRDIGTVILPDADLKIFLTASTRTRAQRRWLQHQRQGNDMKLEEVERNIQSRDHIDSTRTDAPLRPAGDARVVDTSSLDIEQVLAVLCRMAGEEDE